MIPLLHSCARCGYRSRGARCAACNGAPLALDGRRALPPPRADRLRDLFGGLGDVRAAAFAMLHGREFIGALRVPVLFNLVAFAAIVGGGWLLLAPLFDAVFAGPWPVLDGVRARCAPHATAVWLATTWLVLGHPLLDLAAGAVQEPLLAATEARMLRPASAAPDAVERHGGLRLRDRARVVAWLLLVWPVALVVGLLPWIGLPAVLALGAAVAAVVWFEAPMARRGHSLASRLRLLRAHPWRALGLGLGLQAAAVVPFANLLALAPIATIAATASYLRFGKLTSAA